MTGVVRTVGLALLLPLLLALHVTAQQVDPTAEPAPLARGYRTRTLAGGWGHSWLHGWPGYGKAVSDIQYFGFYPQMGWFVTNWLELYGEGTAHVYLSPRCRNSRGNRRLRRPALLPEGPVVDAVLHPGWRNGLDVP